MRRARVKRERGKARERVRQRAEAAGAAVLFFTGREEGVPVEAQAAALLDKADTREELFLRALHADLGGEGSSLDLFPLTGEGSMGALAIAFLESGYRSPAVLDFIALCRKQSGLWGL